MMSKIAIGLSVLLLLASCSSSEDDTSEPVDTAEEEDAGASSDEEPECFENPSTHFEIINACTDSVKVKKTPKLKLLNSDGSLPAP